MKVLFLAPQPFFIERGTPIAVKLALEVLEENQELDIDLLTFHEGEPVKFKRVKHYRTYIPKFIQNLGLKNIQPGISFKKIFTDLFFLCSFIRLFLKNRKKYHLIHAVEESVFLALAAKLLFKVPYVYDMDSVMTTQISNKWKFTKIIEPLFIYLEKIAIRRAKLVLPMCQSIADLAKDYGAGNIEVLTDVSLLDFSKKMSEEQNLRKELHLSDQQIIILYVGNLEGYQGIDLLLESFEQTDNKNNQAQLVIIGGSEEHIRLYKNKISTYQSKDNIHFLGKRPFADLSIYLAQADILASPRTQGTNTSMKLYNYLHAGKAIIATDLETHTQVISEEQACLASPQANEFSKSLEQLITNPELRQKLSIAANKLATENYTVDAFRLKLNNIYSKLH